MFRMYFLLGILFYSFPCEALTLEKKIWGNIAPKSIVHNGKGLFFAQNMMYRHTVTVYNREYKLVKTISDRIQLSKWGVPNTQGWYKGSPVEVAFSHDGRYAWVSNYKMYGKGFDNNGTDGCSRHKKYSPSFLYQIDTQSLEVVAVVQVGSVPKYVATSPDNRWVFVANWCGGDVSVVDVEKKREVRKLPMGRFPRGMVVSPDSKTLYVAIMGSMNVAFVDLATWKHKKQKVGVSPRHLNLSPDGRFLYATLNGESRVAKINTSTGKVLQKVRTGSTPRSMIISGDGKFLYVVNYKSDTVSEVRTQDMKVLSHAKTQPRPIGIAYDSAEKKVWVACYSGAILVYKP